MHRFYYAAFFGLLFFGLSNQTLRACDGACALDGGYGGLFPQFQKHFIGLNYRYRYFQHPLTHHALGRRDDFQVLELQARFFLHERWDFWFSLPYAFHRQQTRLNQQEHRWSGPGDFTAALNYHVLAHEAGPWRHRVLLGAEVQLPTGPYQQVLSNGNPIEAEAQIGTGAYALGFQALYLGRWANLGWQAQARHRQLSSNERGHRFGAQTSTSAQIFYELNHQQVRFLPQMGLAWEHRAPDAQDKILRNSTGGQSLQAQAGLDLFWNTWQLGLYARRNLREWQDFEQPNRPWAWQLSLRRSFS